MTASCLCAPVSVPYRRYSVNSAHWWIGRALHALTQRAGLRPADIDGLSVSSFTLAPDTAIGLTQHLGLSPRWLDHVPMGGASGGVALRRAARAVQAGDADFVACVAGDTNHVGQFPQDAVFVFALRPGCGVSLRLRRPERQLRADHPPLHEPHRRDARGFRPHLRRPARQRATIRWRADEKAADDGRISGGPRRSPIRSICSIA